MLASGTENFFSVSLADPSKPVRRSPIELSVDDPQDASSLDSSSLDDISLHYDHGVPFYLKTVKPLRIVKSNPTAERSMPFYEKQVQPLRIFKRPVSYNKPALLYLEKKDEKDEVFDSTDHYSSESEVWRVPETEETTYPSWKRDQLNTNSCLYRESPPGSAPHDELVRAFEDICQLGFDDLFPGFEFLDPFFYHHEPRILSSEPSYFYKSNLPSSQSRKTRRNAVTVISRDPKETPTKTITPMKAPALPSPKAVIGSIYYKAVGIFTL